MKYFNVINQRLINDFAFFDILLNEDNDQYDFLLLDDSGVNQDIINISLKTTDGFIKDLECVVHSRFGNGNIFRVVATKSFEIEN